MKTLDYLLNLPELFWPPVIAAVCLAVLCAWLSVLVTLRRLAFIGQGISHAGFGGIGVAAVFGLASASLTPTQSLAQFAVVVAFCVAASLAVGWISTGSSRRTGVTHEDTAIGMVLVVSMAVGSILVSHFAPRFQWESFLFGYLMNTAWPEAAVAGGAAAITLGSLWALRRPLMFWAFDEPAARAFGVRTGLAHAALLALLGLATVTAMRLAGVVLASALLILPGAAALKLSSRLAPVLGLSLLIAVIGVLGGLVLSFELSWPPGPSIVITLAGLYVLSAASPAGLGQPGAAPQGSRP